MSPVPPMPAGSRPETELLLQAARVEMGPAGEERVRSLVRTGLDWGAVAREALRHGVLPLVYRNVTGACASAVPAEVREGLREQSLVQATRNLLLTCELFQLLKMFEAQASRPCRSRALSWPRPPTEAWRCGRSGTWTCSCGPPTCARPGACCWRGGIGSGCRWTPPGGKPTCARRASSPSRAGAATWSCTRTSCRRLSGSSRTPGACGGGPGPPPGEGGRHAGAGGPAAVPVCPRGQAPVGTPSVNL
jgi:hypothetical protein